MRKKLGDGGELLREMWQASADKKEFNVASDLQELQREFARISPRGFKRLLAALVDKYTKEEYAAVHTVLMKKCREGDMAAIRLYHEIGRGGAAGSEGVTIINDIG